MGTDEEICWEERGGEIVEVEGGLRSRHRSAVVACFVLDTQSSGLKAHGDVRSKERYTIEI